MQFERDLHDEKWEKCVIVWEQVRADVRALTVPTFLMGRLRSSSFGTRLSIEHLARPNDDDFEVLPRTDESDKLSSSVHAPDKKTLFQKTVRSNPNLYPLLKSSPEES